ncbi:MAG: DeoR/GlpR family DNA-binding transcription regulator [Arenicellales bacterium]|nr:DeoR/GlpR family DNA-binding transcription regulator [Arenicellales bacterium]
MNTRLSKNERWERILSRLNNDVTVRISALAEQFGVTTETIRRDIDELTEQGLVSRTYGGAASRSLTAEPNLLQRRERHVAERQRIAQLAISLVQAGDVIMIDSGSTTYQFALALSARTIALTVLTNCLPIAQNLGGIRGFKVILCPGTYSKTENAVYGQETIAFLDRFQANKAVIGAGGLTANCVTDADTEAAWVKRKMIERSEHTILVLDHSKFDLQMFDRVCPLSHIQDVVVDRDPPEELRRALRAAPVQIYVAN